MLWPLGGVVVAFVRTQVKGLVMVSCSECFGGLMSQGCKDCVIQEAVELVRRF